MENLTDYYTDINKLEEEVERLEEELESYDVQKLMVDDVKFCENKINNIPKEINRIIDTEIKKLKIRSTFLLRRTMRLIISRHLR